MRLELRLSDYSDYKRAVNSRIDCIGIGDEGCLYRMPDVKSLKEIIEAAIKKNIRPRLVTPRVAQRGLKKVINMMEMLSHYDGRIDIIVNDLGVLELCREMVPDTDIYFGRQIARSIFDCPWYDFILKGEKQNIIDDLSRHSYDQQAKYKLLKTLRVKGIEINFASEITVSLKRITANGFNISIHLESNLLTAGRECVTARHLGLRPMECSAQCKREYEIEWDGIWQSPTLNDVPADLEHKQCLAGAYVRGNRVLQKKNLTIEQAQQASATIVILEEKGNWNQLDFKINQLQKDIEQLKRKGMIT